jgi:hypothetical protein
MGMVGQRHVPAALPSRRSRYPVYRRLDGPQGWSGRVRKISIPPGIDPWTTSHSSICLYLLCMYTPHGRSLRRNMPFYVTQKYLQSYYPGYIHKDMLLCLHLILFNKHVIMYMPNNSYWQNEVKKQKPCNST